MYLLPVNSRRALFPPVDQASPEGLLAIGGDLSSERLLEAYRRGIFPWYSAGQPILWWSPDPRAVLWLDRLRISRSLRKTLRRGHLRTTLDRDFRAVIEHCAAPRRNDPEGQTWITMEMMDAYVRLHRMGHAHSVETWQGDRLVGGLYGVALGSGFFGESMFSLVNDASKVALVALVEHLRDRHGHFVDCQLPSPHVMSLGAEAVPRSRFLQALSRALGQPGAAVGRWESGVGPA